VRKNIISIISVILILSLIQFMSCSNNSTAPSTNFYRDLWERTSTDQYVLEQTLQCFCLNGGRQAKFIFYGDQIGYAMFTDTNEEIPEDQYDRYKSVDDLFDYIDELRKQNPYKLEIEYDPDFGYPTRIYVDRREMIVDEELAIISTISQLGED